MKPHKATITSLIALASCIACGSSVEAQVAASTNPLLDCSKWDSEYQPTKTEGNSGNDTIGYEPVAVDDSDVSGGSTGSTTGGATGTGGVTGTGGSSGGSVTPTPSPSASSTPTPTPTPKPTASSPVITTSTAYYTSGGVSSMRVTSAVHAGVTVKYYRAGSVSSKYKQNLSAVKSYPTPSGSGVLRTVGGQKILSKNGINLSGLDPNIINVIDEINLTAAALGLPDPVVTAGHDTSGHSSGSLHYSGDAIDLRCNSSYASASACKQWVVTLANALGTGYDVIFEDYGGANSHVHIGWKG
jgi:hypothetical protein